MDDNRVVLDEAIIKEWVNQYLLHSHVSQSVRRQTLTLRTAIRAASPRSDFESADADVEGRTRTEDGAAKRALQVRICSFVRSLEPRSHLTRVEAAVTSWACHTTHRRGGKSAAGSRGVIHGPPPPCIYLSKHCEIPVEKAEWPVSQSVSSSAQWSSTVADPIQGYSFPPIHVRM